MDARVLLFPSFLLFSLMLGSVAPSGFRNDAPCHGNEAWNWVHPIAPPKGFPLGQVVPFQTDESQFPQESSLLVGGNDIPPVGRGLGARSQCPRLPACSSRRELCWLGLLDPSDQRVTGPVPRRLRGPCSLVPAGVPQGREGSGLQVSVRLPRRASLAPRLGTRFAGQTTTRAEGERLGSRKGQL